MRRWDLEGLRACYGRAEREAQGPFEAMGFDEREVTENVAARTVGDDTSGVEQYRPGTELEHHFEIVGRYQLGAREAMNKLNQPSAPLGSRLAEGSSSTSTDGSQASTPARQTRLRSPKLR